MTQLVRWEPLLRDFERLTNRIHQMMTSTWDAEAPMFTGEWVPPVDIYDEGNNLILQAELPATRKDDIDIRVENNVLTLSGERRRDPKLSEDKIFRSERGFGKFSRAFTLPSMVEISKIEAKFKDGVLSVRLPKVEKAKPRQIEVKAT